MKIDLEKKYSRRESIKKTKKAPFFFRKIVKIVFYPSVIISVCALVVSVYTAYLQRKSVDYSIEQIKLAAQSIEYLAEPEIDVYLKHGSFVNNEGLNKNDQYPNIIFGLNNLSQHNISELSVNYDSFYFWNEKSCQNGNLPAHTKDYIFVLNQELKSNTKIEESVPEIWRDKGWMFYIFNLDFKDAVTNKFYKIQKKFVLNSSSMYKQNDFPKTENFTKILNCIEQMKWGDIFIPGTIIHL